MKINEHGLKIIKDFEGLRLKAYPDIALGKKRMTIGYGHTSVAGVPEVYEGMIISEFEANRILKQDLLKYEAAVKKAVKVPLTSNQFSALVSLVYNIGISAFKSSTLLRLLNARDYSSASYQFSRWNKAGGRVLTGLIRRRNAEAALFSAK